MTIQVRTYAAATCSWINPSTALPENDAPVLESNRTRSFLTGEVGFRFCNFADVFVQWDSTNRRVLSGGFRPSSGIYRAPSLFRIPSHSFPIQQRTIQSLNGIEFIQIAGARTVTAEVGGTVGGGAVGAGVGALIGTFVFPGIGSAAGAAIGAVIGAPSGQIVAHQVMNFPPIWSKLKIVMFHNGQFAAKVLQHSYFPSLTLYAEVAGTSGQQFAIADVSDETPIYHADNSPHGEQWHKQGWGLSVNGEGPSPGNPWGSTLGVSGGQENLPN